MRRLAGQLALGNLIALPARESSLAAVERCVKGAADYFKRTEGARPAKELAAERLFDALADDQRRLFVVARNDEAKSPVGILDLAMDTPHRGEVTLALLAIVQSERGKGVGREVAEALFGVLAAQGYQTVKLGVAPGEDGAAAFWSSLGMWEQGEDEGVRLFELGLARR